jgi:hypothetical protein
MSRVTEAVYVGRDNVNTLEFRVDGKLIPLNPITKMDLVIPALGITLTDEAPTEYPLKWMHNPSRTGIFEFRIGYTLSNQPHGDNLVNGIHKAALFIYNSSSANGRHWTTLWLNIDIL